MKKSLFLLSFIFITFYVYSTEVIKPISTSKLNRGTCTVKSKDNTWFEISKKDLIEYNNTKKNIKKWVAPNKGRIFFLDNEKLVKSLERIDSNQKNKSTKSPDLQIISLPNPNGGYSLFSCIEDSIMAPELANKYPKIKTYSGVNIKNSAETIRFDYTPHGFHAQILSPKGCWYIDPYVKGDSYVSFFKKDYLPKDKVFKCLVNTTRHLNFSQREHQQKITSGDNLRTYRLAVACTGEYAQFYGGTVAGALAGIVTTINRVTGIYEQELAIRLILVSNNDTILYTDAATDPFTNNNSFALIDESQATINSIIGAANYDIGHTVSTGGGGLASLGAVCIDYRKASGITGSPYPTGDAYDVDYVAHEMGHQFGANHSFNGTTGSCSGGNRNGSTAYEPGSGTTIMAYAGICGDDNVQMHSDPVFHSVSYDEIMNYTTTGSGNSCPVISSLNNQIPVADAGTNYTIPKDTPFLLTGSATDGDTSDTLSYFWEERDLGPQVTLDAPDDGSIPLFRVFTPSESPTRFFPKLSSLASGSSDITEKLPHLARDMDFRLTVRDGNGGVNSSDMVASVVESAGPFQVTSTSIDNNDILVYWDVSNTDVAPINCTSVNIYISTDAGLTYDLNNPVVSNTTNDGFHSFEISNENSSQIRVMVKASNNIFFSTSSSSPLDPRLPSDSYTNHLYIPLSQTNTDFTSYLGLYNPGDTTTNFTLNFVGADGYIVTDPFSGSINSLSKLYQEALDDNVDNAYWIMIGYDNTLDAYLESVSNDGKKSGAILASTKLYSKLYVPHIAPETNYWNSYSSIVNGTNSPITTTFNYLSGTMPLNPPENAFTLNYFEWYDDLFASGAPDNFKNWGIIECATKSLCGMEMFSTKGELKTLGALDLSSNSSDTLYFAHVDVGGGNWWTGVVIENINSTEISIEITPYDVAGNPLTSVNYTMASYEKLVNVVQNFWTDKSLTYPTDTAWFKVVATGGNIIGYELFGTEEAAGRKLLAGINAATSGNLKLTYPHIDVSATSWTGITVVNIGDDNTSLSAKAYDVNGTLLQEYPVKTSFAPNEKYVNVAENIFNGGLPIGTATITIEADNSLVGFELWGDLTANFEDRERMSGILAFGEGTPTIGDDFFYFESFEATEYTGDTIVPDGWEIFALNENTRTSAGWSSASLIGFNGGGTWISNYPQTVPYGSDYMVALYGSETERNNQLLVSVPLTLPADIISIEFMSQFGWPTDATKSCYFYIFEGTGTPDLNLATKIHEFTKTYMQSLEKSTEAGSFTVWTKETFDISAFAGKTVRLCFEINSQWEESWHLDGIGIK